MKRRSWIWFIASALLAVLAGVLAIVALRWVGDQQQPETVTRRQQVVVARQPIAANSIIRVDNVAVEERDDFPSGAAVKAQDVVGQLTLRDVAQGEAILMQDITSFGLTEGITGTRDLPTILGDDKLAVALPANDIMSRWGAVLPGDHVDVLFTLDIILETPMYPQDTLGAEEGFQLITRDQSFDSATVLALQNLEIIQFLEEPRVPTEDGEAPPQIPNRAMVLKIDPQDAVVLKYLKDSISRIDLALRSPQNETLFDVEAVNINYLVLRYGIVLPEELE
jgi:pilus assembly protein CpaB